MSVLHLQHTRSDGERDTFHLKGIRRYHLGRGSSCELRILDMKMSRQHCAFEYVDGAWMAVDLGSTNGFSVDGERVTNQVELSPGETLQVGSSEISVVAISDHLDISPEELMLLGPPVPEQETMPTETEDVPVPNDPEPWDGELNSALEATADNSSNEVHTAAIERRLASPEPEPAPITDRATVTPIRTPIPEPAKAFPHGDGDALEQRGDSPRVDPAIASAATSSKPTASPETASTPRPVPSTGSVKAETMVVTLLGKRIGPLPRDLARELKKKQIMGTLTEAELDQYPRA